MGFRQVIAVTIVVELTGRQKAEGKVWEDKAGTPLSPTHWGWVSQEVP